MAAQFDDLLKNLPVKDLASRFNVDEGTMLEAVSRAVPGLVGGMAANASTDEGAASLERATDKHTRQSASLAEVDEADGKKIVRKVLGEKEGSVAAALGSGAGDSQVADLIPKLLPIVAPLVMQFLAGQLGKGQNSSAKSSGGSGGGIIDILGGILGGGSGSSGSSQMGGLGGILGGLFGKR